MLSKIAFNTVFAEYLRAVWTHGGLFIMFFAKQTLKVVHYLN